MNLTDLPDPPHPVWLKDSCTHITVCVLRCSSPPFLLFCYDFSFFFFTLFLSHPFLCCLKLSLANPIVRVKMMDDDLNDLVYREIRILLHFGNDGHATTRLQNTIQSDFVPVQLLFALSCAVCAQLGSQEQFHVDPPSLPPLKTR